MIKIVGGGYLVFLGVQAFVGHRRKGSTDAAAPGGGILAALGIGTIASASRA